MIMSEIRPASATGEGGAIHPPTQKKQKALRDEKMARSSQKALQEVTAQLKRPDKLSAKKLEKLDEDVKQVLTAWETFKPPEQEELLSQLAQSTSSAIEIDKMLARDIIQRNDPQDIIILGPILERLSPELLEIAPFAKAKVLFFNYLQTMLLSDNPDLHGQEELIKTALKFVVQFAPDASWFDKLIFDERLSNNAAKYLMLALKQVITDHEVWFLDKQSPIKEVSEKISAYMQNAQLCENLEVHALFRLASLSIRTDLNSKELTLIAPALQVAQDVLGNSEEFNRLEKKFLDSVEKLMQKQSFPDAIKTVTFLIGAYQPYESLSRKSPAGKYLLGTIKTLCESHLDTNPLSKFSKDYEFQNLTLLLQQDLPADILPFLKRAFENEITSLELFLKEQFLSETTDMDILANGLKCLMKLQPAGEWFAEYVKLLPSNEHADKLLSIVTEVIEKRSENVFEDQLELLRKIKDSFKATSEDLATQGIHLESREIFYLLLNAKSLDAPSILRLCGPVLEKIPAKFFDDTNAGQRDEFFDAIANYWENFSPKAEDTKKSEALLEASVKRALKLDPDCKKLHVLFEKLLLENYQPTLIPLLLSAFKEAFSSHSEPLPEEMKALDALFKFFKPLMTETGDVEKTYKSCFKEYAKAVLLNGPDALEELINSSLSAEHIALLRAVVVELKAEAKENQPLQKQLGVLDKVFLRFDQLKKAPLTGLFEEKAISDFELLQKAYVIVTEIELVEGVAAEVFERHRDDGKVKIARSMFYDPSKKKVYISTKKGASEFKREGRFKNVRYVMEVSLEELQKAPSIEVRAFTKDELSTSDVKKLEREIALYNEFKDTSGIVQLKFSHTYTRKNGDTRVVMVFEKFQDSARAIEKDPKICTTNERLELFKQYAGGLSAIHKTGRFHGDVKPENFLFRLLKGLVKGVIGDLGFCQKIVNGKRLPNAQGLYNKGYYGSIWYTSPELFGEKNFAKDHQMNDVWALGISLYQMSRGKPPAFVHDIEKAHENNLQGKELEAMQAKVRGDMKELEAQYEVLKAKKEAKEPMTPEEQYDLLMLSLLVSNPEERRKNFEAAKVELENILTPPAAPTRKAQVITQATA